MLARTSPGQLLFVCRQLQASQRRQDSSRAGGLFVRPLVSGGLLDPEPLSGLRSGFLQSVAEMDHECGQLKKKIFDRRKQRNVAVKRPAARRLSNILYMSPS